MITISAKKLKEKNLHTLGQSKKSLMTTNTLNSIKSVAGTPIESLDTRFAHIESIDETNDE